MGASPEAQPLRLFVAVDVPAPVRAALDEALRPLRRRAADARWVPPERWHLTLAFLGHLGRDRLDELDAALTAAAGRVAPFHLALSGNLDRFGGRVLFADLDPSEDLHALAGAVRAELAHRDLPSDDRPFRAHVTVARAPGRGRLPRSLGEEIAVPAVGWHVEEVALVRSQLGRGGAAYTRARAHRLGGDGQPTSPPS